MGVVVGVVVVAVVVGVFVVVVVVGVGPPEEVEPPEEDETPEAGTTCHEKLRQRTWPWRPRATRVNVYRPEARCLQVAGE